LWALLGHGWGEVIAKDMGGFGSDGSFDILTVVGATQNHSYQIPLNYRLKMGGFYCMQIILHISYYQKRKKRPPGLNAMSATYQLCGAGQAA
jgi:hypothetical protein